MVDGGRDTGEEPVVGCIVEHVDVVWDVALVTAEAAPSFGHEGPDAGFRDGFEDEGGEAIGVVDGDAAEAM